MEMKKTSHCSVAFFLGLLILTASPVSAQLNCVTGILPSLLPCKSFLSNLLPILPNQECCAAAKNFTGLTTPANLCQCLKLNLLVSGSGLLPFKLDLIPNLCSITSLVPIVGCILGPNAETPAVVKA